MAKQLLKLLSILLVCCMLTACSQNVKNEIRDDVQYEKPIEIKSEFYYIDTTQKDLGYITFYMPANWFIIMKMPNTEFEQTLYSMKDESRSYKIPLSYGNGIYEFELYDPLMRLKHTEEVSIENIKEDMLYIMSNDVINFSSSDLVKMVASEAYTKSQTNYDYLTIINRYVYKQIEYDVSKRDVDMFVTVDNILTKGSGVCYEKAKLLAALLRVKNIPCKLVFGNYKNEYHAWCEVFVDNKWVITDPTSNSITSIDNKSYTNRVKIY